MVDWCIKKLFCSVCKSQHFVEFLNHLAITIEIHCIIVFQMMLQVNFDKAKSIHKYMNSHGNSRILLRFSLNLSMVIWKEMCPRYVCSCIAGKSWFRFICI